MISLVPRIGRTLAWLFPGVEPRLTVRRWEREGRPVPPPPAVKQRTLREYARRYKLRTFVETGTLHGDTTAAIKPQVDGVITIELSPELAERARLRFAGSRDVHVLEGDSGELLPDVLASLQNAALFWLGGHYSGGVTGRGEKDTPIRAELAAILDHTVRRHVVLIDDARLFDGGDYPSLEEVEALARARRYRFEVRDDIIRLTPD
jgi:hypothetical protein